MSEENSFLFAEYAKPVSRKGRFRLYRLLLILAYTVFATAYVFFFVFVHIPHLIAILPLLVWILVFFTWGAVSFEYRVKVESGLLTFGKLRNKKEKILYTVKVKDLCCVDVYTAEALSSHSPTRMLDCRSEPETTAYFIVYKTEKESVTVLFEATDSILSALRYYNKDAVRVKRS